tara:strand:- start:126 stop:386 length:261 start_codon:yes stop_codon:yes gene_type:complete
MIIIEMTTTTKVKKGNKFVVKSVDKRNITMEHHRSFVESKEFFKNLGSIERHRKTYTCAGYKVFQISTTSPDRNTKVIREFDFQVG